MAYQVLPASLQDVAAIGDCADKAFAETAFDQLMYPKEKAQLTAREARRAWRIARHRKRIVIFEATTAPDSAFGQPHLEKCPLALPVPCLRRWLTLPPANWREVPDAVYFKAVPAAEPNAVVGYAGWLKPGHFSKKATAETPQPPADSALHDLPAAVETDGRPACLNHEALDEFSRKMAEAREEIWSGNGDFWYLASLGVDPEYKRRGIARQLMQHGLDRADEDGLPIYLEATPDGALVYLQSGFKECGRFDIADGGYVVLLMIRQPGAGR